MSTDLGEGLFILALVSGIFGLFWWLGETVDANRAEQCAAVMAVAHSPSDSLAIIHAMPECAREGGE